MRNFDQHPLCSVVALPFGFCFFSFSLYYGNGWHDSSQGRSVYPRSDCQLCGTTSPVSVEHRNLRHRKHREGTNRLIFCFCYRMHPLLLPLLSLPPLIAPPLLLLSTSLPTKTLICTLICSLSSPSLRSLICHSRLAVRIVLS